jgi:hypothetical protein
MQKNTSGQKWLVFAFYLSGGAPVTGDAANITAKIRKDNGTATATDDVNPTEIEDGYYEFTLTQEETNAYTLDILPESTTSGVQVIGVPGRVFTTKYIDYGSYRVILSTKDDSTNLVNAICSVYSNGTYNGVWTQTVNGSGNLYLMAGDYTVVANPGAGYTAQEEAISVSANTNIDFVLPVISVASPSSPGLCVVTGTLLDASSVAVSGATVSARVVGNDYAVDNALVTQVSTSTTTDANGYFTLELIRQDNFTAGQGYYRITFTSSTDETVYQEIILQIPNAATADISDLI